MKILFAIAVFSFAALVWAGLAIVRHVRKSSARAARQPAADAELSEAIDLRLTEITRSRSGQRPAVADEVQQDFSYFNRDSSISHPDRKSYSEPPPIKPAVADRS